MKPFKLISDYIRLEDYQAGKVEAQNAAARRYARGNIAMQEGLVIDRCDLATLRVAGDKAYEELMK